MKRRTKIIIGLVILAAIGIYLNRSYAYIYSKFDQLAQPKASEQIMKVYQKQYVAIGDSLTYGTGAENTDQSWPALLANKLSSYTSVVELINLGVPGATSADVLADQVDEAIKIKPEMITLFIGINDIHNRVSLADYERNLDIILKTLTENTQAQIYLIDLPYLGADSLMLPPYDVYFDLLTKQFNSVINKLALKYEIKEINIYKHKAEFQQNKTFYSFDEFHPSAVGYSVWANLIYDQLK